MARIAYYLVDHHTIGGIQTHLITLATAVSQHGHDVHAILPGDLVLDPMERPLTTHGVKVHRQPAALMTRSDRLNYLRELYRTLRRIQPDLLHIQESIPAYDKKAILAARAARVPFIVITEHDFPRPTSFLAKRIQQLMGLLVNGVINVSQFSRRALSDANIYPKKRLHTIYNGINVNEFAQIQVDKHAFDLPSDAIVVGSLSRLEPHKGVDLLLAATARLAPNWPNLYVLISGDGPENHALNQQAADLGIANRVRFLGRYHDAVAYLNQLDVFVFPSRWEAFGLVAAEAMAVGKPVVGTDVGGLPEVIVDKETGFIVPVDDLDQLTMAISTLLSNPKLRQRMGEAGKTCVHACFSTEIMAKRTMALYENILTKKSPTKSQPQKNVYREPVA